MSKRTSRRLAVVAGAALAVGSMAPAMAARVVDVEGTATVAVDHGLDLNDLTGSALGLGGLLDLSILGDVLTTVQTVPGAVLNDVFTLPGVALGTAFGAVDLATQVTGGVVDTALQLETVGVVTGTVGSVAGIATGAVGGASLTDPLGTVIGLVPGGLLNGGLEGILSGGAGISVVANLLAIF